MSTAATGIEFLLRWVHYLGGITWVGLLYYFNFVQGEYLKEALPEARADAIGKLVPRALFWFRWAAMLTFVTGALMLASRAHQGGIANWSFAITIGALLGTLMFLNVWLVIWPNQRIVCGMTGGDATSAAARALLASRTNALFSAPMLFFMAASSHFASTSITQASAWSVYSVAALIAVLELNGLKGKPGPLGSIGGVIVWSLALTLVLYMLMVFL